MRLPSQGGIVAHGSRSIRSGAGRIARFSKSRFANVFAVSVVVCVLSFRSCSQRIAERGNVNALAWVGVRNQVGHSCCKQWINWRRSRTPLAAEPAASNDSPRTWKKAHEFIKSYEGRLKEVIATAGSNVRELDALFGENMTLEELYGPVDPDAAREAARPPPSDNFFVNLGRELEPRLERLDPDVESPVLAGEFATGTAIRGRFSSSPVLKLPERLYGPQLSYAVDDPSASAEENKLWNEAVLALAETMDPLYAQAEAAVAMVAPAEDRAEKRRAPFVDDFRKRVIQQMIYAKEFMKVEELEKRLTTLQTDTRLKKYLTLLERSAMRAEELQRQIRGWQKYEAEAVAGSPEKRKAGELIREAYQKTKGLDLRIEACIDAASEETLETMDAYNKIGEELDKLNPFKMFR